MFYKPTQPKIQFEKFTEEQYFPHKHEGFTTTAIHEGHEPEPIHGSVNVPIHMSTTYAQKDINQPFGKFDYTRGGNPTRQALEDCIKGLEYGKFCITFASGCGGTASVMHLLKSGDEIVVCDDVYGGTQRYMKLYSQQNYGIKGTFVDMTNLENIEKAITEKTKIIWLESPTNPTMKLIDVEAVCKIAKKHNILTVVDNTFATAYIQSPILLGADIVYHSCTKYMGGHSDVVMGALVLNDKDLHARLFLISCSIGANPSPFDCFLMNRGIKTLGVRVTKATQNAYHLAHFAEKLEFVESISYPGLKSHPQHQIAKKQMRGYGGMFSFRVKGGKEQVSKFLKAVKVFTLAESLGGVQSLIQCPCFMTHASVPPEIRVKLGITENLIRVSVGLETLEDLIYDFDQALKASQK